MGKILNLSQPATSQHLKILKNIRILESKKEGNCVYYRINKDHMLEIKKQMDILFDLAFQKCDKFPDCQNGSKLS
jgi:DNA-binding transcriptional ArsR family regulator